MSPAKVRHIAGFYGSQIRHHFSIRPTVKLDLFLPEREDTFEISSFNHALSGKPNIVLHQTVYGHGFMNSHSKNYNRAALDKYLSWLRAWAR